MVVGIALGSAAPSPDWTWRVAPGCDPRLDSVFAGDNGIVGQILRLYDGGSRQGVYMPEPRVRAQVQLLRRLLIGSLRSLVPSVDQGSIDQVLTQEPGLEFIGPKHVTYNHTVCTGVAKFIRSFCQFATAPDDDLVRFHKAGNLHWH